MERKNSGNAPAASEIPAVQIGVYTKCAGRGQICVVCRDPIPSDAECACADIGARDYPMHPACMREWQDEVREQDREKANSVANRLMGRSSAAR